VKYLLMFTDTEEAVSRPQEECERDFQTMMGWWGEHRAAGRILEGEKLAHPETATTVRRDGERTVMIDGPFIESKEWIGGYALVDVENLDQALEMASTWPWPAAVEVRPLDERRPAVS